MSSKPSLNDLNYRAVIDSLGDGILIFGPDGEYVMDNVAARQILGKNLVVIRAQGWPACAMLIDAGQNKSPSAQEIRAKALRQSEPVRFNLLLSGAYTPGWISVVYDDDEKPYTMISIERPDWTPLTELMSTFRSEARMAISSTGGHAELIMQLASKRQAGMTVDQLAQRVIGFAQLMATQMNRLQNLMDQIHRLEMIRTGQLANAVRHNSKKINLTDFLEDFLEEINEEPLVDPEKGIDDYRDRIELDISDDNLEVYVAPNYLTFILRDVLRNSFMYSEKDTPVTIKAYPVTQERYVQVDIEDQGYGIRAKEFDRVFAFFQRARQPQIIAEFGYGISLYLCKANIEAMGGRVWFTSEEGVGTTFNLKFPVSKEVLDQATVPNGES